MRKDGGSSFISLPQRADRSAALRPPEITAVNLDQLSIALASETRLVKGCALLPGKPESVRNHPPPERLTANLDRMPLKQDFGCKRWAEVSIMRSDQLNRIPLDASVQLSVRSLTPSSMNQL